VCKPQLLKQSSLSPPILRWRGRGEKRKITSFWKDSRRSCSSPLPKISQEILLLIHSAALLCIAITIFLPMDHGREVEAL
jgi:hypothetical protein